MFWLLFIFYVARSAVPSCTEIPAGSSMKDHNGNVHTFPQPVVAGKCSTQTDAQGHIHSRQFVCSGTTAADNFYNASTCTGTPVGTNPVTLNGACATGGCAGFTDFNYNTADCTGKATMTTTNEYLYWATGCHGNSTSTCVGGVPTISFFNNTACSGTARHTMASGECNRHNAHASNMMKVTDSPC